MNKSKKTDEKVIEKKKETKKKTPADRICPTCYKPVVGHKCRLCGATIAVSSVSGNVVWMRNGRLIAAFHDEREAYVKMAVANQIPEERWPERFKTGSSNN